jgi:uncharacterized protein YceK
MKRTRSAAAVALAVALSGCGTVYNLAEGEPEVYGGALKDAQLFIAPAAREKEVAGRGAPLLPILALGDLPLSLVGDTLTLPLAVYLRQKDASDTPVPAGRGNPGRSASSMAGAASLGKPCPMSQAGEPATPAGIGRPIADPSPAPDSRTAPPDLGLGQ